MKAILIKEPGGVEQLIFGEIPNPKPKDHEILIKVQACALNRLDILQREGRYPIPEGESPILGIDVSGKVETVGSKVKHWKHGDKVMGLVNGGGYAEFALMHEEMAMPKPDNLSFEEAASVPEAFLTAYQALFWIAGLKSGENVLIHAGASGVGTAAIQLVRMRDAIPIVTAGSAEKICFCRDLGAKIGINYHEEDFSKKVLDATNNRGANIILDFVGAPYWKKNWDCLAKEGHLVLIASMGGSEVETVDLKLFFRKWATVTGTTLRARSLEYKIRLVHDFLDFSLVKFHEGRLKAVVDKIFDWSQVKEAHLRMEANENKGKIILTGM